MARKTMEMRSLWVSLSDEQVEARARQLSRGTIDLADAETEFETWQAGQKEAIKARRKDLGKRRGELEALAHAVAERRIRTDIECDWHYNLTDEGGFKILVRRDTGEAVERRTITAEERQLVIGEKLEEANVEQLALWEQQLNAAGRPAVEDEPAEEEHQDEQGDIPV